MAKIKTRKLYAVRHHAAGCFGRAVGFKARLLPRAAAARIARRLRKSGLDISIDPVLVNVTNEQAAYLDRRYA